MGNQQDIMHTLVQQEIRHTFPGWSITPASPSEGYNQAFLVEQQKMGRSEKKMVMVSFDQKIEPEKFVSLANAGRSAYGVPQQVERVIIVPQNADTTATPPDMRVASMRSFAYEGNNLVWLKKPGRKSSEQEAEAAQ